MPAAEDLKPRRPLPIEAPVAVERAGYAWIVVTTKAGKETFAKYHLQRQGFEVYLPMRLGREHARPFFPRHLFVRITADVNRWQAIFSTMGVQHVLCTPSAAVGVSDALVRALRNQEFEGYIQFGFVKGLPCPYKPGDDVAVDGFMRAVFLERIDDRRADILVSWLGRDSRLTVDLTRL